MTTMIPMKSQDRMNSRTISGSGALNGFSALISTSRCRLIQSGLLVLSLLLGPMVLADAEPLPAPPGSVAARSLAPILRAVVSETNPVPYAMFSSEGKLMGGISKSLLDQIGLLNQLPVLYLDVPRARVESWLLSNKADVGCFLSPDWVSKPAALVWTGPLFYSSQLIVRRSDTKPVTKLSDLYHKRIGTIRGFVYPELQQAFNEKLITRDDAHSLESNLTRLAQGRLDAVMTVDLSLGYIMTKRQFDVALSFDPLWTEPPAIYCAISADSPLRTQLLESFSRLQQDGYLQQLLQLYQPVQP